MRSMAQLSLFRLFMIVRVAAQGDLLSSTMIQRTWQKRPRNEQMVWKLMVVELEWTIQSPSVLTHPHLVFTWASLHSTVIDATAMMTMVEEVRHIGTRTGILIGNETIVKGTITVEATVATHDHVHAHTHHVAIEVIHSNDSPLACYVLTIGCTKK